MTRRNSSRLQYAGNRLSDPHGIWCAWCLQYIDQIGELELHHMLAPRDLIKKTFDIEPWMVPVHAHPKTCHRNGLQPYADYAGRALLNSLNLRIPKEFEILGKQFFNDGYLSGGLLLHSWSSRRGVDPDARRQQTLYALISAAGSNTGLHLLSANGNALPEDPETRLYLFAALANAGYVEKAVEACHELQIDRPRVRAASNPIYSKFTRVNATLLPGIQTAREAVRISKDSSDPRYQSLTAQLTLISAHEARKNFTCALDIGLEMAHIEDRHSWWHQIQIDLALGRGLFHSSLGPGNRPLQREAMKRLTRGQYVAAMLDIAGLPVIDFREAGQRMPVAKITPTEHVHWYCRRFEFSREEMAELRQEAIFEGDADAEGFGRPIGLQNDLIKVMVGHLRVFPTEAFRETNPPNNQ